MSFYFFYFFHCVFFIFRFQYYQNVNTSFKSVGNQLKSREKPAKLHRFLLVHYLMTLKLKFIINTTIQVHLQRTIHLVLIPCMTTTIWEIEVVNHFFNDTISKVFFMNVHIIELSLNIVRQQRFKLTLHLD